jgi:hypothetical protein
MEDLIPALAYRYKPTEDYLYSGEKSSIKRCIYYKTQFTVYEKNSIQEFKNFIITKLPSKTIPEFFGDEELLRVLIRHKFSYKKAIDGLIEEIEWRTSILPNSYQSLGLQVQNLLNSGIVYITGRDNRFRPLLIVNIERLEDHKTQIEKITYLLVFFIEFIRSRLSIPGKVENFILLLDMCGRRVKDAPVKEVKKLYDVIQGHYPDYMSLNYIVNSGGKGVLGSLFNNFMDYDTNRKTIWDKDNGSEFLSVHFNSCQYEAKYGGGLEEVNEFWPVNLPIGPFNAAGETQTQYLFADESSESEFQSISEKISISLPFTREDQIGSDSDSIKFDSNSYNVNVDVPASIEDPEMQNMSQYSRDSSQDSKTKKKFCCKTGKCLIM